MARRKNSSTTIFDQSAQTVTHQVNIAGGDNQTNQIDLSSNAGELFSKALDFVANSNLPASDKVDVNNYVKGVEDEVAKGDKANEGILKTLLRATVEKLPEIAVTLLNAILSPSSGASSSVIALAKNILNI